jgi:hypothetical protein
MSGKSLKVVVEINEAYPLLHSAFARIPANVRSERLRALAMIGMYLEGGSETFRGIPVNMGVVYGQLEPIQFAVFIGETQPKLLDQLSSISKRASRVLKYCWRTRKMTTLRVPHPLSG